MLDRLDALIRSPERGEVLYRRFARRLHRLPGVSLVRKRRLDRLASRIVWVLGSGRTGSTWVTRMLSDSGPHRMWNEPLVGALFGDFQYERASHKSETNPSFILSGRYTDTWLPLIRSFILENALIRYPEVAAPGFDAYLFVKEPNGSLGSPLLMRAVPESRMLFLVRDPRDSVASRIDARAPGGWLSDRPKSRKDASKEAGTYASRYARSMTRTLEAYRDHHGFRSLVSYEELLDDALGSLRRVVSELDLSINDEGLSRSVEKHSWENIPEDQKGAGKKFRKGEAGGWREDLSPDQIRTVERITGSLMDEFGYTRSV